MIQNTTLQSWMVIEHVLSDRQAVVHFALSELGGGTNTDIAEHLGWSVHRVTPRVLELRKEGIVACTYNNPHILDVSDCPCRIIQNGRKAMVWQIIKKRW